MAGSLFDEAVARARASEPAVLALCGDCVE